MVAPEELVTCHALPSSLRGMVAMCNLFQCLQIYLDLMDEVIKGQKGEDFNNRSKLFDEFRQMPLKKSTIDVIQGHCLGECQLGSGLRC